MGTLYSIVDFVYNNLIAIGGILISPTLYRIAKITVFYIWSIRKRPKKVTIKYFHNGIHVRNIDITVDSSDPIFKKIMETTSHRGKDEL